MSTADFDMAKISERRRASLRRKGFREWSREPLTINKKKSMFQKLKSRKLWATIIGALIVSGGKEVGLTPDMTQWIATIVTGYVIGQGIADAGQAVSAK